MGFSLLFSVPFGIRVVSNQNLGQLLVAEGRSLQIKKGCGKTFGWECLFISFRDFFILQENQEALYKSTAS